MSCNREILNQPHAYISLRSTTGHVSLYSKITMKNNELYQPKVDVGMLNTVKIYWADLSSVSPLCSDEGLNSKRQLNKSSRCLTYPHQLSVDTIHCFTRYADTDQHSVLRGTSIPFHHAKSWQKSHVTLYNCKKKKLN